MKTSADRKFTILDSMVIVAATALGFGLLRWIGSEGFLFRMESVSPRYTYLAQCGNEAAFPFLLMWTLAFLILRLRQPRPTMRRLGRQPGMAACSAAALVVVVPLLAIVIPEMISSVRTIGCRATPTNTLGFPSRPTPAPSAIGLAAPSAINAGATYGPPLAPFSIPGGQPPGQFPTLPQPTSFLGVFDVASVRDGFRDPFPLWYIARAMHQNVIPRAFAACGVAGAWLTLVLAGWWRPERSWIDRFGRALGIGWIVVALIRHGAPLLGMCATLAGGIRL